MMNSICKMVLLTTLLASSACLAQVGKQDIRGFTPGMTFAEAGRVVKEQQTGCSNFSPQVIPYGINCGEFTLWFSTVLDGAPLMLIYMELRTTASTPEIVQSLSEQFGKTAVDLPPENGFPAEYGWDLGGGKRLRFTPNGRQLHYLDSNVVQQDQEERLRRSRVPVPKL
jgi:hypothetical protein